MDTLRQIKTGPSGPVEGNAQSNVNSLEANPLEADKLERLKKRFDELQTGRHLPFKEQCGRLRGEIQAIGDKVRDLRIAATERPLEEDEVGELRANVMLAYRHLEDARMRIGKVLQVWEGGVSIYDKASTHPGVNAGAQTPEGDTQG